MTSRVFLSDFRTQRNYADVQATEQCPNEKSPGININELTSVLTFFHTGECNRLLSGALPTCPSRGRQIHSGPNSTFIERLTTVVHVFPSLQI